MNKHNLISSIKQKKKPIDFYMSLCVFMYVHTQTGTQKKVWKPIPVVKHYYKTVNILDFPGSINNSFKM